MTQSVDKRSTEKKKTARKARKKVASKYRFMPSQSYLGTKGSNLRWLKDIVPDDVDWADLHDDLLELMTSSSPAAMANKRNMYAHLNAARYAGIAECLRIVKKNQSQAGKLCQIQRLLNQIIESGTDKSLH